MCELRHHPCDDFVTHKMCTLPEKWIRQPARVALSRETIYPADAGSGIIAYLHKTKSCEMMDTSKTYNIIMQKNAIK